MQLEPRSKFRLGEWAVEPRRLVLRCDTEEARIEPRMMSVLTYLARHAPDVVSRDELARTVWHDVTVCDAAITQAVVRLRRALGDDAKQPRFIETVPKIGYRIVAEVDFAEREQVSGQARESISSGSARRIGAGLLAAVALVSLFVFVLVRAEKASPEIQRSRIDGLLAEARQRLDLRTAPDLEQAERAYRTLLALRPDDGRAEAGLARLAAARADLRLGDRFELYHEARSRADRALALDPQISDAHLALATTRLLLDWDPSRATESIDLALRLAPGDPNGHQVRSWALSASGDHAAAEKAARRAVELDPESAGRRADLAFVLLIGGHLSAAITEAEAALGIEEAQVWASVVLIRAYLGAGHEDAAQQVLLRMVGSPPPTSSERPLAALDYWSLLRRILSRLPAEDALATRASAAANLGDVDRAMAFLEAAFAQRDWEILWLEHLPELASLRREVRFRDLLRRRDSRLRG